MGYMGLQLATNIILLLIDKSNAQNRLINSIQYMQRKDLSKEQIEKAEKLISDIKEVIKMYDDKIKEELGG